MACKYNLGQKQFNSEIELEEYLLNNESLIKQFGDEVFSKNYTTVQNQTKASLLKSNKVVSELIKEGKVVKESTVTEFSEEHYKALAPYQGVTAYLREYMVTQV